MAVASSIPTSHTPTTPTQHRRCAQGGTAWRTLALLKCRERSILARLQTGSTQTRMTAVSSFSQPTKHRSSLNNAVNDPNLDCILSEISS